MKLPKNLIFFGIFAVLAIEMVVPIIQNQLYLQWQLWIPTFFWLIGGKLGYFFYNLDRLVDIYLTRPTTELAVYVKKLFAAKQYKQGWQIIQNNKNLQPNLTFRSAVFQVIWIALAFFTITSTESMFGKGFIIGLGLHLLLDQWEDYLTNKAYLKQWLFWQINREISDRELKIYLYSVTGISCLLLLMVV